MSTASLPPTARALTESCMNSSRHLSSSLTAIRKAWKTRVAGWIRPRRRPAVRAERATMSASSLVVRIGARSRAHTTPPTPASPNACNPMIVTIHRSLISTPLRRSARQEGLVKAIRRPVTIRSIDPKRLFHEVNRRSSFASTDYLSPGIDITPNAESVHLLLQDLPELGMVNAD